MDNNGKINIGADLGTTNSAIAVMENGMAVIKKSNTLKDTLPSVVSVTRRGVIHVGDVAANELANQVLRATKTWDLRYAATDVFQEFKRTMGTQEVYRSKNLKKEFTSEQLSAEIIKVLAANAGVNDGGGIVISVPAKFDATQKTATVEAARLAGFKHVELIQEPIAAAIAYGLTTGESDGYWLVFDLGGGTFDAALLIVEGGVQQVVDTEGDRFLGGKDLDYAIVDKILLPHVKKRFKISNILASEKKANMLREALKTYAEWAKIQLSTASCVEVLSDLGDLGCDDKGKEIEIDLTITREMADPIMEPFFKKTITICKEIMKRNHLDGDQLTKLILVGGPTYSPCLRRMLKEEVTRNVDTSIDPMTAVAKGATLYAATRDLPSELQSVADEDAIELELHYDTMSADLTSYLAVKVKDASSIEGMSIEIVRSDGAWSSGIVPYEEDGIVVELTLNPHAANNFNVHLTDSCGRALKATPNMLTILQGTQISAAPLPYHIGFGIWDTNMERQAFMPFQGLEKNKPVPAYGVAHGRKTSMRLEPGDEDTILKIPVYQATSSIPLSPAGLYEYVADVVVTGKDVTQKVPAGSDVVVQVTVDSSEMMQFKIYIPSTDEEIIKQLDTSPRFKGDDADKLINEYYDNALRTLKTLEEDNLPVNFLKDRLYNLKHNRHHTERKAIVEQFKELLRDIYQLECATEWERTEKQLDKAYKRLKVMCGIYVEHQNPAQIQSLEIYINSAKAYHDVAGAKELIAEISRLQNDLLWERRIPEIIRWYNNHFDDLEWTDEEKARQRVDYAMTLIEGKLVKNEIYDALNKIRNCYKGAGEIREAEGLLS